MREKSVKRSAMRNHGGFLNRNLTYYSENVQNSDYTPPAPIVQREIEFSSSDDEPTATLENSTTDPTVDDSQDKRQRNLNDYIHNFGASPEMSRSLDTFDSNNNSCNHSNSKMNELSMDDDEESDLASELLDSFDIVDHVRTKPQPELGISVDSGVASALVPRPRMTTAMKALRKTRLGVQRNLEDLNNIVDRKEALNHVGAVNRRQVHDLLLHEAYEHYDKDAGAALGILRSNSTNSNYRGTITTTNITGSNTSKYGCSNKCYTTINRSSAMSALRDSGDDVTDNNDIHPTPTAASNNTRQVARTDYLFYSESNLVMTKMLSIPLLEDLNLVNYQQIRSLRFRGTNDSTSSHRGSVFQRANTENSLIATASNGVLQRGSTYGSNRLSQISMQSDLSSNSGVALPNLVNNNNNNNNGADMLEVLPDLFLCPGHLPISAEFSLDHDLLSVQWH